jgi:RNA polymerase primary sigma factor
MMTATKNYEINIYKKYLDEAGKFPLLSRREEGVVLEKIREGSQPALNLLINSNLRFVVNVAKMYQGQGMELTDLISEGNLGLIEAAHRFDATRNLKFISYAVWWIRQAINRALVERNRLVRISAEKELILRRFNKSATKYRQVIGGQYILDTDEISSKNEYAASEVEEILTMGLKHASLDAPIGENGETCMLEMTACESYRTEEAAETKSDYSHLRYLISRLDTQEATVLSLYFGIDKGYCLNLVEIGEVIGKSKERVRQIKENALVHLRELVLNPEILNAVA